MVNHLLETSQPPLSSSALSLCVSAADPAFHSSPFFTSLHHYLLTSSFPYTLPSSVSRNPFICHSYENTGGVGVFFPFWNHSYLHSRVQREIYFFFLATRHPPLATFFPNASSTGAAMISRTRSRRAGTSSFVKPLVSIVS